MRAKDQGILLPEIPRQCDQSFHMFYMLMPNLESRQELISHLKKQGILSVFHYLPLHLSDMGRKFGGKTGDCPVTEEVSDRLVRLPFYNDMTEVEQARIVAAMHQFECHVSPASSIEFRAPDTRPERTLGTGH
jgi:dTDP-4-amino-4,6-dideoxygalactose transaminase